MIVSFLITIGNYIFFALDSVLPDSSSLPAGVSNAMVAVGDYVNAFAYIFPVSTIFIVVGLIAAYQAIIWTFKGLLWVWHKIPFIGR